ncbi:MAG TPA: SH3 domain-containing protein [Candidatus Binatia bacterium]|nr:SH3 domain-containing protein [Candidatus Binatia bacterium]
MSRIAFRSGAWLLIGSLAVTFIACKDKGAPPRVKDLPDLNEQTRVYVTTENAKVRTGPGPQFRAIAEIGRDAKVNVVGKDGDWVLIVSKKGNAPGYIELASVMPWEGGEQKEEAPARQVAGSYEAIADTQVRSGPGLHYPVLANISKGTKLNVVEEEKGWYRVESRRGNKPGYVDANMARPAGAR